jgi:hypothetical protein
VQRLVEMPVMQLDTATAERVLEALVRSCDKTVERNGHMRGGFAHAASTAPVLRNHRCTFHILSEPRDKSACRRAGGRESRHSHGRPSLRPARRGRSPVAARLRLTSRRGRSCGPVRSSSTPSRRRRGRCCRSRGRSRGWRRRAPSRRSARRGGSRCLAR